MTHSSEAPITPPSGRTRAPRDTPSGIVRRWRFDGWSIGVAVGLLALSWVLASGAEISGWEEEVFRFFNDWPDWLETPSWPVMQFGAVVAVPVIAAITWLLWRNWRVAGAVVVGGFAAWILAKVVKELVERGRPADYLTDVILRPAWEGLGFVSGHAATAAAIAVTVSPYLRRPWKAAVWGLAIATGVLRMYTAAHLPLDVVGGLALGVVAGAASNLAFGVPQTSR